MNLGKAIKVALAKNDIRQNELAARLGVSDKYISRVCNQENVGMNTIRKIADELDMKVSELVALGEE